MRENIEDREIFLHSDNGSPMKGATLLATMQRLGVIPSFSRPSVSNDNPYSEALFKTCKYHPDFPEKPFEIIEKAREWVAGFVLWYNEEQALIIVSATGTPFLFRNFDAFLRVLCGILQFVKRKNPTIQLEFEL